MATLDDYFSFQVFLIILRETLESAIIVSVLLAFLHQSFSKPTKNDSGNTYSSIGQSEDAVTEDEGLGAEEAASQASTYKYLKLQVWIGGLLGLISCMVIGTVILTIFYIIGSDLWSVAEHYWEGTFSIVASIIISVMGIKILRVNKMQEKWKHKLTVLIQKSNFLGKSSTRDATVKLTLSERFAAWSEKYSMFILPFVTTLREGMEAIVFIGGIGINENTSFWAIFNSAVSAIVIGTIVGIVLYRTGNSMSLQWFLIMSTCFLYLIAAGLFSKGVWNFELQRFIDLCDGFDVSETGHGPGSYDITKSIWHVNCCNGELQDDGAFWMIVTAIFGWTNSATYGSVISYISYWVVVIAMFRALLFEERHGYLPVIPIKLQQRRIKKNLAASETKLSHDNAQRTSVDSTTPLNA